MPEGFGFFLWSANSEISSILSIPKYVITGEFVSLSLGRLCYGCMQRHLYPLQSSCSTTEYIVDCVWCSRCVLRIVLVKYSKLIFELIISKTTRTQIIFSSFQWYQVFFKVYKLYILKYFNFQVILYSKMKGQLSIKYLEIIIWKHYLTMNCYNFYFRTPRYWKLNNSALKLEFQVNVTALNHNTYLCKHSKTKPKKI